MKDQCDERYEDIKLLLEASKKLVDKIQVISIGICIILALVFCFIVYFFGINPITAIIIAGISALGSLSYLHFA